jgi:hypothetical protein
MCAPSKSCALAEKLRTLKASLCFEAANRDNADDLTGALLSGKIEDGVAL